MVKFLHENGVKTMVEVGSAEGNSALSFLSVGMTLTCVDPYIPGYDEYDGQSKEDKCLAAYDIFQKNILAKHKHVKHIKKTSEEAVSEFDDKSLDFVYIDGNHRYEHVKNDLLRWKEKIKDGGYIGGHDLERVQVSNKIKEVKKAIVEVFGHEPTHHGGGNWTIKL